MPTSSVYPKPKRSVACPNMEGDSEKTNWSHTYICSNLTGLHHPPMILTVAFELALMALLNFGEAKNSSSFSGSVSYEISRKKLPHDALGFSIGPVSITEVVKSNLTANLLQVLSNISGSPVPIRIGGAASDKVTVQANLTDPFLLDPEARDLDTLFINEHYFDLWKDYFPAGTQFTYTLNFANMENTWGNATTQAKWAIHALGDSLDLFELGDSPDHYAYLAYRNASTWNSETYAGQFNNLSSAIVNSFYYRNASHHPALQAGGFADPPDMADQQWEDDDLDIINITMAGLRDSGLIETYAVHLFPEANTPPIRKTQISLDLLSNHDVIYKNLSQYSSQAKAAAAQDSSLVLAAAGSVAGGASGVSDTFGAALWGVDFVLTAASLGIPKTYLHFDGYSPDSPIIPIDYQYRAQHLNSGVRANFYTSLFLAHVLNSPYQLDIGGLPDFNSTNISGFALFSDRSEYGLQKLVFVNLGVYNTSSNLWNPASQSRKNGTIAFTNQTRPTNKLIVNTPWKEGTDLAVIRLEGPGTNARTGVRVAGQRVDSVSGELVGSLHNETLKVGSDGTLTLQLQAAEAVALQKIVTQNSSILNETTSPPPSRSEAELEATGNNKNSEKKKKKKNAATSLHMSSTAILSMTLFAILI